MSEVVETGMTATDKVHIFVKSNEVKVYIYECIPIPHRAQDIVHMYVYIYIYSMY